MVVPARTVVGSSVTTASVKAVESNRASQTSSGAPVPFSTSTSRRLGP
ncbi:hypothetical protein Q0F99_02525 [Rathayibacter oskolensis]|nr:hypothetical protein [Rathayibacter oskolensis]WKK72000.1 hypothetical protein Q0F99_02525 [Rathayibacter oskolensis]